MDLNDNSCVYRNDNLHAELILAGASSDNSLSNTQFSRVYNKAEDNITLIAESNKNGFHCTFAVLAISDSSNVKELAIEEIDVYSNHKKAKFNGKKIQGLNITFADEKYTVVVTHTEYCSPSDVFIADGCVGYGSVVVFNRSMDETETGTVLLW